MSKWRAAWIAILVLGGCGEAAKGDSVLSQLTDPLRSVVSHPKEVTARRIRSFIRRNGESVSLETPQEIGESVKLTPEQRAKLASLFTRKGATVGVPACIPHPGIRFEFSKGESREGRHLPSVRSALFKEGQNSGAANFDNVKPQMVEFVKNIFSQRSGDPKARRPEASPV